MRMRRARVLYYFGFVVEGPGSTLIGSTRTSEWDASEFWELTLPFDQEVASIRRQLPVGGDLQGLMWCLEEVNDNGGYVHWK